MREPGGEGAEFRPSHPTCRWVYPAQSPPSSTSRPGLAESGAWSSESMWNPTGLSGGLGGGWCT